MHIHIPEDLLVRGVAEAYILHVHLPPGVGEYRSVRHIGRLGLLVQDTEHTLGGGEGRLELVHDVGKLVDGAGEFTGVLHELGHTAQRDKERRSLCQRAVLGVEVKDTAEHGDQADGQIVDEHHARAEGSGVILRIVIGVGGFHIAPIKAAEDLILPAVGLNGAAAREHLLGVAVELAQLARALAEQGAHLFRAVLGKEDRDGHRDCKDEDQRTGDLPHEDQRTGHGVYAGHHLHQIVGQGGVHRVDVVGDAADDIAGGVGVEVAHGQMGEFFKELFSHGVHDLLADAYHQQGQKVGQHRGKQIAHQHTAHLLPHHIKLHAPLGGDGVQRVAGIGGAEQGQLIGNQCQHDGQQKQRPVLQNVLAQAQHDASGALCVQLFKAYPCRAAGRAAMSSESVTQRKHLPSATG